MADYIVTNDGELKHYGVKGMKWGVRRSIGVKSRAAALNKMYADSVDKNIKRLEAKKSKKGLSDRQAKNLKASKKAKKEFESKRNTLIKDMNPKDIKRGERAVAARFLLGASRSIYDIADLTRADKQLERERNR